MRGVARDQEHESTTCRDRLCIINARRLHYRIPADYHCSYNSIVAAHLYSPPSSSRKFRKISDRYCTRASTRPVLYVEPVTSPSRSTIPRHGVQASYRGGVRAESSNPVECMPCHGVARGPACWCPGGCAKLPATRRGRCGEDNS